MTGACGVVVVGAGVSAALPDWEPVVVHEPWIGADEAAERLAAFRREVAAVLDRTPV